MNTQVKTALIQLAEGTAITAILAGIVAAGSYLQSNNGQVDWRVVASVFVIAFATSAAHSLATYFKTPAISDVLALPLQGDVVQPPSVPAPAQVQPPQNVATTTNTAAVNEAGTKTQPLEEKPAVSVPDVAESVPPQA